MKKIAIFCFSGTGNTYFVGKTLCEMIGKTDQCDLYAIENHREDADRLIDRYDIIGLGYPTYGSSLPPIVFGFIDALSIHQKMAFVFCTQLLFSGDGAAYGGRQLEKKGFVVLWQEHFPMPNNITDFRILDRRRPYDFDKIAHSVQKRGARFVKNILGGKECRKGSNFVSLLLGRLQRVPFENMDQAAMANSVTIESERCSRCGLCVELCPVSNLRWVDDRVVPKKQCTLCYRCVNHCPIQAIHLAFNQPVKHPYHGPTQGFQIGSVRQDVIVTTEKNR